MCTAISIWERGPLYARTLDLECSLGEMLCHSHRGSRFGEGVVNDYSIIGVGICREGQTLYFDGMNEYGLFCAGLNFDGYAVYHEAREGRCNIASYQFIPYILGKCRNLHEARKILHSVNITPDSLSTDLPSTPLHWIIADESGAVIVESVADGLKVYDNEVGVLTNSPDFPFHKTRLADFMSLSPAYPDNRLTNAHVTAYSRGMGALGLPGDFSSVSRFVRAAFLIHNTRPGRVPTIPSSADNPPKITREDEINRLRHIISGLSVPLGCVLTREGRAVSTVYTSIADPDGGRYYLTDYYGEKSEISF